VRILLPPAVFRATIADVPRAVSPGDLAFSFDVSGRAAAVYVGVGRGDIELECRAVGVLRNCDFDLVVESRDLGIVLNYREEELIAMLIAEGPN
jgi:hypothetical protein